MSSKIIFLKTAIYAKQFINWWLGYMLSQPVDIDLSVLGYFARSYVGYSLATNTLKRFRLFLSEEILDQQDSAYEEIIA